jgi:transcriptional regulator with XRE-family HTH domain
MNNKAEKEFLQGVGERVAFYRKQKGLTQDDLGYILDMEDSNISRIENGRANLTLLTCLRICNALDIQIGQLFDQDSK